MIDQYYLIAIEMLVAAIGGWWKVCMELISR